MRLFILWAAGTALMIFATMSFADPTPSRYQRLTGEQITELNARSLALYGTPIDANFAGCQEFPQPWPWNLQCIFYEYVNGVVSNSVAVPATEAIGLLEVCELETIQSGGSVMLGIAEYTTEACLPGCH